MFRGGTSPICFTTTILAITVILMITMIKDCDCSMTACNGSTTADCQLVSVEEEEEFMMDSEEHRRILEAGKDHLSLASLDPHNPACAPNCGGKLVNAGKRKCTLYDCER
ncbi:rapid ALkalinization Factor [Artemisia annua]|uniref:Rapid ALkalinization Factor n=1 Tax=Artemisia annua TaxID=35608 RepID=A0A2U1LPW1_ARTAN|nr:rapid ALkalinization Factor [Artemisia annua]